MRNSIWWWEDYGYPIIGITVITLVLGLLCYGIYWRYQHPCIKYEPVWVDAWVEMRTIHHSCGKDCDTTTVIPIYHPAHYEQRCAIYGNRSEGDREGTPAPIPDWKLEK